MEWAPAPNLQAWQAWQLVRTLQRRFVAGIELLAMAHGFAERFVRIGWLRAGGRFGGGQRLQAQKGELLNAGTANISQAHYTEDETRRLACATALSTIMHPAHPEAPSVHIHISYTEPKGEQGYWRLMADLNPALPMPDQAHAFLDALKEASGEHFEIAKAEGERYFWIPALARTRGQAHFYLERFHLGTFSQELAFAARIGKAAIDRYLTILDEALSRASPPTDQMRAEQLAYHTLYAFQVLTLDRGTTAGLLVHDENDLGILGSLPARIDASLFASWRDRAPEGQRPLIDALVEALGDREGVVELTDAVKLRLAQAIRRFYRVHPEALELQASASIKPPTLNNHGVKK